MDQPRGPPNPGLDTKGSVFGRAEKPQQQLPPFVLLEFQISSAAAKRAKISIFHPKAGPGSPFACRLAADGSNPLGRASWTQGLGLLGHFLCCFGSAAAPAPRARREFAAAGRSSGAAPLFRSRLDYFLQSPSVFILSDPVFTPAARPRAFLQRLRAAPPARGAPQSGDLGTSAKPGMCWGSDFTARAEFPPEGEEKRQSRAFHPRLRSYGESKAETGGGLEGDASGVRAKKLY